MRVSTVVSAIASVAAVQALSTQCTTQVGLLALGDLGSCLQITNLLPVLSASGSIISPLNTYLGSLCAANTTSCSNATLTSAQSSIQSACSSDVQNGGTDGAEVSALNSVLQSYPQFKAAACAKNSTTNDYCVTGTLTQVQNITGQDVSANSLLGLLGGGSLGALQGAFQSGQLCTGCVSTIYQQAVSANASIASSPIGSGLTQQCGANFAQSASGVSTVASSAASTQAASSSAAASSSRAAAGPSNVVARGALVGAAVMLGAVAVGGALVL